MSPKIVFVIPYRNRESHKEFFLRYMNYILEDYNKDDYDIIFSHQKDSRPFNRGAVKNIGFKFIKNKYPDDYANINIVFHDIDVMPSRKNLLHYETTKGVIKHFYGFNYALGGIISIKGSDFEKINGYPNYWSWSLEDNCLQKRALNAGIVIDRSNFYKIGDHNILHIHDGFYKDFSDTNVRLYTQDTGNEGLNTIYQLYTNEIIVDSENNKLKYMYCDINKFETLYSHTTQNAIEQHDLRSGNNLSKKKSKKMTGVFNTLMYNK